MGLCAGMSLVGAGFARKKSRLSAASFFGAWKSAHVYERGQKAEAAWLKNASKPGDADGAALGDKGEGARAFYLRVSSSLCRTHAAYSYNSSSPTACSCGNNEAAHRERQID